MATEIRISPAAFETTIVDDRAVRQDFTATLVNADGTQRDVTDQVSFSVDSRYGTFNGHQLTVTGEAAGPTDIVATLGTTTGAAPLTVNVQGNRLLDGLTDVTSQFDHAASRGGCAPALAYPENATLVPANLGALDVHWTDAVNDLFRVHVHSLYVDMNYFIKGARWMTVDSDWSKFATAKSSITIEIAGMTAADPSTKCISSSRRVDLTRDDAKGGVYYWSTNWEQRAAGLNGQDIMRFDLAKPQIQPQPLFTDANRPSACVGCHALSRDGKRIALTLDSATGRGSVIDLSTKREMMPAGSASPRWSTAVFNADGNKLVTVTDGQMRLISADGGETLATIPNTSGYIAGNPELSPDGTKLVNVESVGEDDWAFGAASIVVRSFDDRTNTFGAMRMLLPFETDSSVQSYYPSWSPDGRWLAVTRSPNGSSFANPDATVWVIKADGTLPAIELPATKGTMDSYARWMPAANKAGDDESVFFLSFASTRAFGTRLPDGGMSQIWITPFYPMRAEAGRTATGTAYRAPFQSITSSNHNAQWTSAVVVPQ